MVLEDGIITHFHEERDIAFASDFCNNYSHPGSPASLFLTSPLPCVPYVMFSSPSSRVPKSQVPTHASRCPRPLVPVPLLYTASIFLGRSRFYRSKVLLSEKSVDGAQLYKYVSSSRDRCIRFPCVSCCSTIARKRRVYGSWNCQKLGQRKESSTAAKTEARICQI